MRGGRGSEGARTATWVGPRSSPIRAARPSPGRSPTTRTDASHRPATGVVTVADASLIDYEGSGGAYTIEAQVSDGSLTSTQSFAIAVTNVAPSAPTDADGAAGGTIAEDAAVGATVGITATSADPNGGTVTYSLVDDAGGRFGITSLGVVVVAEPALLDYESHASHTIVVRATDAAGLFTEQSFTIAVTDVAPPLPADTDGAPGAVVDEGLASGAAIGITAQASDVHGGTVTYDLTTTPEGCSRSTDHRRGGGRERRRRPGRAPSTIRSPSGERRKPFGVADLHGDGEQRRAVRAGRRDAARTRCRKGADGASVGLTLTSTDPGGATLTWSLTDDAGGRFAIDTNGLVTVADASLIDYEGSGGSYTIVAEASDGSLSSTQSFTIAATNVAPASADDSYTTDEDATLTVAARGTLGNDSDVNGGALTATLQDGPLHAASSCSMPTARSATRRPPTTTARTASPIADGTAASAPVASRSPSCGERRTEVGRWRSPRSRKTAARG